MGELDLQIVDIPGVAKHLVNFVSLYIFRSFLLVLFVLF